MSEGYTVAVLSPLRRVIAARMTEAKQTIPHFRLTVELNVDGLLVIRRQLQELRPQAEVSINDLLLKACATALVAAPAVNIQWVAGEIRRFRAADIALITAVEGGLSAPIVRSADAKTIWQISAEARELVSRAKRHALRMDELTGGSFSMSNLGMYGVDQFDAIINPPQCAILALGGAAPRCVVSAAGALQVATTMHATLSVDHRALDGVAAAEFLAALREVVEQPAHLIPCGAD